MAVHKAARIAEEVGEQLLAGRDPAPVFESGGLEHWVEPPEKKDTTL